MMNIVSQVMLVHTARCRFDTDCEWKSPICEREWQATALHKTHLQEVHHFYPR